MVIAFLCYHFFIHDPFESLFDCLMVEPQVSETVINGRTTDGKISVTSYIEVDGPLGGEDLIKNVMISRAYATDGGFLQREGKISIVSPTRNAVTFEVPRTGQWYLYVDFVFPVNDTPSPCRSPIEFEVYVSE